MSADKVSQAVLRVRHTRRLDLTAPRVLSAEKVLRFGKGVDNVGVVIWSLFSFW
jgi:hypothetical protein